MNIKDTKIVLASASPRRLALLEQVGVECEVIPSGCEEIIREISPDRIVRQLASDKAHDVFDRLPGQMHKSTRRQPGVLIWYFHIDTDISICSFGISPAGQIVL